MADTNETTVIDTEDSYEPLLPDGYGEGDDIFNADSWSGNQDSGDAPKDESLNELFGIESENLIDALEAAGTMPQSSGAEGTDVSGDTDATSGTMPTEAQKAKLKFRASIDHNEQDVELDEDELPTLYQKAYATDRAQQRLTEANEKLKSYEDRMYRLEAIAKNRGFESGDDMIRATVDDIVEELTAGGTPEAIARDYVERMLGGQITSAPVKEPVKEETPAPETEPVKAESNKRDYKAEVAELMANHGELRGQQIPEEVVNMAAKGTRLSVAYEQYLARQAKTQAEKLQKDYDILRQNAASASRGPVRGTRGGTGAGSMPSDSFLRGFDEDY